MTALSGRLKSRYWRAASRAFASARSLAARAAALGNDFDAASFFFSGGVFVSLLTRGARDERAERERVPPRRLPRLGDVRRALGDDVARAREGVVRGHRRGRRGKGARDTRRLEKRARESARAPAVRLGATPRAGRRASPPGALGVGSAREVEEGVREGLEARPDGALGARRASRRVRREDVVEAVGVRGVADRATQRLGQDAAALEARERLPAPRLERVERREPPREVPDDRLVHAPGRLLAVARDERHRALVVQKRRGRAHAREVQAGVARERRQRARARGGGDPRVAADARHRRRRPRRPHPGVGASARWAGGDEEGI